MNNTSSKPICFVIMGFGEKTDFRTQRKLDLDKTYRVIIKPAVVAAGLECVRADEVMHAGVIDMPMYELLLKADVVVADLSTSNENAIYELGVRHALKPHTTIAIAETEFKFPFDIGHLLIRNYEHLGRGIDAEEAERARNELTRAISELMADQKIDSPVYTFLNGLKPPELTERERSDRLTAGLQEKPDESFSVLMEDFKKARGESDFVSAQTLLTRLHEKVPGDSYITQQLALATYKSERPDKMSSLNNAKDLLLELNPHTSNDAETLGLWGAVHKRLWQETQEKAHLDEAIAAYSKGFYLRNDYYNGINYAFLLNARACVSDKKNAITDFTLAERVRLRLIQICESLLAQGINDDDGTPDQIETFWVKATLLIAQIGIGDIENAAKTRASIENDAPEQWMLDTMNEHIAKLDAYLSNPPI